MTFSELIRIEEEMLKRLLLVSQRQLELVQDGNVTALIEYLGQRQRLWNEFETIEQQLEPHKKIPPEQRVWKNPEERQRTEAAVNRCKELLEQIMATDEESLAQTAAQKAEVEEQLAKVQRSGRAATAYGRQSQLTTHHPDTR